MTQFRTFLILVYVALALVSCKEDTPVTDLTTEISAVDRTLLLLLEEYDAYLADEASSAVFRSSLAGLVLTENRVLVDAVSETTGAELKRELEGLGATHCSSYKLLVSCFFPIDKIRELDGLQGLKFVRPARPTTRKTEN